MGAMPNVSFAESLSGKLHKVAGWLIIAFVVAAAFGPMLDNVDLGWHVAQGRWMAGHFAIYRHDFLNYPNFGSPVVDEYPFFQIVLYLATTLGWWGPCLLTALAYTALIWMLLKAEKGSSQGDSALLILAIGLMLVFFQVAFPLRPHLVTYLAIATLGVFLLRHREPTGWIEFWPMALLQVVWVNSHSAFVLGPAMVGLFGLEMVARHWIRDRAVPWKAARNWLGALLLILLACWINPYGVDRFYLPFYQDRLESIRAYVGKWNRCTGGPLRSTRS